MKVEIRRIEDRFDCVDVLSRSSVKDVAGAKKTLSDCLAISSYVFVGEIDGKIACVWGLVPPTLLSDQAYMWLLTTDLMQEHQFVLVRHSQRVIEDVLKKYNMITGVCIVGENKSIRWLKWLGAEFGKPDGNKVPFVIRTKNG
jgi:hypothetical protein